MLSNILFYIYNVIYMVENIRFLCNDIKHTRPNVRLKRECEGYVKCLNKLLFFIEL